MQELCGFVPIVLEKYGSLEDQPHSLKISAVIAVMLIVLQRTISIPLLSRKFLHFSPPAFFFPQ